MTQFTEKNIERNRIVADREDLIDAPLWWHNRGLSQTASGYGARLTTRYKINFCGKNYRIYCTCFSNVGSNWFRVKGEKIFVG